MNSLPTNTSSQSHDIAPHTSVTSTSEASTASAACAQPASRPGTSLPVRAPQASLNPLVPQPEEPFATSLFEPRRAMTRMTPGAATSRLYLLRQRQHTSGEPTVNTVGKETSRLSAADWDQWVAADHSDDVTVMEAEHFQRIASPMPGKTSVDVASGTGRWKRQLASRGMTVTGYDVSDEALRQAETAGSCARVSYRLWDIVADPIPQALVPGQLDVVTCQNGLPYLEQGGLLTDVGRWRKPSGAFYAVLHVKAAAELGSSQSHAPGSRSSASTPFYLRLQEKHVSEVGVGWVRREVHPLSSDRRAIVLRGYGLAPWEWRRVMDEPLTPPAALSAAQSDTHRTAEDEAS
ncbi:class I SAM-dependent methyltransferase [Streptomyces chartreusis]|uniref:class I SAM-dependent methyltransferase n=1 Tax=Streptomyces chartreusis TaxID=1969 RepID=UPI0037AF5286